MPQDLTNCPHERRPGTMVCLHCRHAERLAARAVRARMFSHVMIGGAILGVIAVVASAATAAFDGRQADAATAPTTAAPVTATASLVAAPAPVVPSTPPSASQAAVASAQPALVKEVAATSVAVGTPALAYAQPVVVSSPAPAPAATAAKAAPAAPPLIPMVPEGTSPLADSMTVVRQGDTMLVHFDTELGRTRRQEKFDAIVRATLTQIYGSPAESLLSTVATGTIGRDGDLLAELPTRGIRLRAADGSTLALWPITRPGRDGPLVVSYRAVVTP